MFSLGGLWSVTFTLWQLVIRQRELAVISGYIWAVTRESAGRKMRTERGQLCSNKMFLFLFFLLFQVTKNERQVMKPLYDRYRLVKQILCRASTIPVIVSVTSLSFLFLFFPSTAAKLSCCSLTSQHQRSTRCQNVCRHLILSSCWL